MKRIVKWIFGFLLIFVFVSGLSAFEGNQIKVTILYDNYIHTEGTKSDWGYSCLIEGTEKTILFDTGTKGDILMYNMRQLNIDPKKVDLVVISHEHGDHTGGLPAFSKKTAV